MNRRDHSARSVRENGDPPSGGPPHGRIEREKVGPLPVWGWGLLTAFAVWALYILTLAPTTGFWDTSEYITTAHILGLPHPPGNPLFVVVGRVWEVMLGWTGLPVALRINLLSATLSATATFFWFLVVARIVARFGRSPREVALAAMVAVWIGATVFTVWTQSNLNEKVYTLSLFFVACVSYLAMLWADHADTFRGRQLLLLIAFLLGLGWSNHTMSLLPVLALAAFVLRHRWRAAVHPVTAGAGLLLLVVGYSLQLLFVPIRSAQNPIIDEADPECPSLVSAITPKRVEDRHGRKIMSVQCEPLAMSLIRDQYGPGPITERQAPFTAQLANYWQYFDWQWARTLPPIPRLAASILFLFFALLGLWTHWKRDRRTFYYGGTMLLASTLLLVFYLNFKYGYSIYLEEVPNLLDHEVRERDYFFIIGFQLVGIYAGLGLVSLWGGWSGPGAGGRSMGAARVAAEGAGAEAVSASTGGSAVLRSDGGSTVVRTGGVALVAAVALVPLLFNYARADRTGEWAARNWAYNMLQSVEPYAVLFTNGDNDTFPLWYLQEVEGIRRDVTVMVHSYLNTKWYPKQLRDLTSPCGAEKTAADSPTTIVCQRPFDFENAVGPYAEQEPRMPRRSIISMSDQEIDDLNQLFRIPEDTTFTISPWITASLRGNTVLQPNDIMVYRIIVQSLGDRPVYFAATAPPVFMQWGLQPHLRREGLALRLVNGPLVETADVDDLSRHFGEAAGSLTWIDRTRTRDLLWDVFEVEDVLEWDEWPEPSTKSTIPGMYYVAYQMLGLAEESGGDGSTALRSYERATRFARLAGLLVEEEEEPE